jgi:hypothetical protein
MKKRVAQIDCKYERNKATEVKVKSHGTSHAGFEAKRGDEGITQKMTYNIAYCALATPLKLVNYLFWIKLVDFPSPKRHNNALPGVFRGLPMIFR